ncbi:MAG: TfoX domain-containing protein [Candidatus Jorgensenbacteria bacterium GW2011_GWA1_48_13]|uniref:TfoX domain-containing protein n=2 Tax=Candidatus Joergenseniibacteriota TaxID=1752739 RepID=A0A0G1YJL0_9BACT|nr:MAG: TfoX domain-containing protein [Candidatus Jorgensenbacteria bacterium GW2011_GWA1_48_13]KKU98879.1 MAG: TfoX domain protein [Candidatus Jorgensenbacteria bacterium GW2011_GWC1_48_8]KKW15137.1 MAG: TfoX domain-containing protein [Candidatus Jorgensenbacteria bacterium GW2011_GWB1_50_10]
MLKRDKSFHDYVLYDLLGGIDGVVSRPMFSGWGIYKNGKIFAFIIDSDLYFKGNKETSRVFEEKGGKQFDYVKKSHPEPVKLPYWSVPEEILEDREVFTEWVSLATKN